jgi:acyl-CoA thioester hydrolase
MHDLPPAAGPFHTPIRVRYEETDAAGVVYYANYLVYFEVARVESLRAVGLPITEVERRGVLLPAVSATCTYHSPAHLDDLLDVAMWIDHVGRASFGFGYEVRRVADDGATTDERGVLIASGSTRHAVVARDTMRPVRIEGWIADLVARAQEWRQPS